MSGRLGFPVLVAAIVIDADNNLLRLDEAGVVANATIASGTYYLRGDQVGDDFCLALAAALNGAFASANTYQVTLSETGLTSDSSFSIESGHRTATVDIRLTAGAVAFRVKWSDVLATFAASILGFVTTKAAANTSAEQSTLSPISTWVGNQYIQKLETGPTNIIARTDRQDGGFETLRRSTGGGWLECALQYVFLDRTKTDAETSDQARAFQRWLGYVADGRPFELWIQALPSGSTLLNNLTDEERMAATMLDDGTLVTRWVMDTVTGGDDFRPERDEDGLDLYSFGFTARGYIA